MTYIEEIENSPQKKIMDELEKETGIVKKCAVREYPKSWIGRSQAAW